MSLFEYQIEVIPTIDFKDILLEEEEFNPIEEIKTEDNTHLLCSPKFTRTANSIFSGTMCVSAYTIGSIL